MKYSITFTTVNYVFYADLYSEIPFNWKEEKPKHESQIKANTLDELYKEIELQGWNDKMRSNN